MPEETKKARYDKRHSALKSERGSWLSHWRELSDYIQPRRGRFLASDRNKGGKRNENIINSTATRAVRILSSGMMSGITSPSRPWFKLTTPDPDLAEYSAVKAWLSDVEDVLRLIFARSNFYNALHQLYGDLAVFGTSPMFIEEDHEDVIRCYVLPIGQYCLANNARLSVDTCFRELGMTVGQLVQDFGLERCSPEVRRAFQEGNYDQWHDVVHVLQPNPQQMLGKMGPAGMGFRSCWYEKGTNEDRLLHEGGYHENPCMSPRWTVAGEDIYGSSPCMDVLGDVKALQLVERRAAQAFDKIVTPPMQGPSTMLYQQANWLAGELIKVDAIHPGQELKPAVVVHPQAIEVSELKGQSLERRINQGLYADLWLALTEQEGRMTAREVAERHEEKMLQLGPVLERLQDELLDPAIDRVFAIALRNFYLPVPPQELSGHELKVEYISTLAQAQKLLGITGLEKLLTFTANAMTAWPEIVDNVDADKVVRKYGDMLGVPEGTVRSEEELFDIRMKRAKQRQQMQAMAQAQAVAQTAKTASEADTGGDNMLGQMLAGLGAPKPQ